MKNNVVNDLAKVLVNNFYTNSKDPESLSGSFIGDILMGLREADIEFGGIGYPIEMSMDSKGMIISTSSSGLEKKESFTWDQVPKADNKKEVVEFVERILNDFFYS
ncbi:hypothetical protein [Acinetobacter beijerinckii]|uniref:hypothetical protein n=1 Tax=Acinetobacter beijerinckii TaxID=262668 RepID=UPI0030D96120